MNVKSLSTVIILVILIIGTIMPSALSSDNVYAKGFDKGPSYTNVVPMEKVTFVNFDEESYLDDYAYLASVPTCVFEDGGKLYSNPLLFYQDRYVYDDEKEKSFNARQGIDYFMEDWMSYCNGKLDQLTLINVPESNVDSIWNSNKHTQISEKDPYSIANKLALQEWSYSDDAVVAVVEEEFEKPNQRYTNTLQGTLPAGDIKDDVTFDFEQTNKLNPQFEEFNVPQAYKYIEARAWWASLDIHLKAFFSHILIPTGDKDIQLYSKYGSEWMQVAAASTNNVQFGMDAEAERVYSYVYNNGEWRIGLTDFPTKSVEGSFAEILKNVVKGVTYHVDIKMYPGIDIEIPDSPPYECNDVDFKLSWDNPDITLGLSLIGPSGEEILSVVNDSRTYNQELSVDELGQCLDGENYKLCVFVLNDVNFPVDFEVEYSWGQRISQKEGDSLTSATEGSVLASTLNAPLLYTSSTELFEETKDVIYKLGVKNIYFVDIGSHASETVLKDLDYTSDITKHYTTLDHIYQDITSKTNSNDIVFSTIDPWTYWYVTELQPSDEYEGALFIGPAAYIAAHHGTPVMLVDNHPELSSAVVWHNEFWKHYSDERTAVLPSVAEMFITGTRVYDFIKDYGFDKEGEETIITVADQYDIGTTWDRVFPGRATPGRIWGTPVDMAYLISRNMFYPALIFNNPAMNPDGLKLINGSKSIRKFPWWGPLGLKIIKPSEEEIFEYPVLHTYVCYAHRLNEMFEKYYGTKYQFANEIIPGETNSFEPIDDGVNLKYKGESGSFYPDLIDSEITPLYASRAGYSNAFSTSFEAVVNDLNKGSLIWIHDGHGLCGDSGAGLFWDVENSGVSMIPLTACKKEENPWRLYEFVLGSTENPDTMTMEVHGVIPALLGNPDPKIDGFLRLGLAWAPAKKPLLDIVSDVLNRPLLLPILSYIAPDWLKDKEDYYDGMVNSIFPSTLNSEFYTGYQMDEELGNIHSCGYITANCLVANTYYHLMLIRHGSPYQIIDPWGTSWYSSAWIQSIPRDLALGHTIGEAYVNGIEDLGILYISDPPQWWWDIGENVVYFGDPDLRPYVPSTEYSADNHWEKEDVQPIRYDEETLISGHMPFGATSYPNAREKQDMIFGLPLWFIVLLIVIILLVIVIAVMGRKRK